jgi:NHL repeat
LKARIAFRALIGAGLFLAWLGLLLPWELWRAEAKSPSAIGADGSVGGFDTSRAFWIVLAVATVLAVLALWRHWRWAFVALAVAALGLVVLAVREIGATLEATSAFVSVGPGAGVILALVGAAALVAAVIVALRPPALQLGAGLAAFALATGGAAAWPQADGRPGEEAIADFADDPAPAMAFLGDALYRLDGAELMAQPAHEREYRAVGVWTSEWSPDDLRFDDFAAAGLAFAGETAYIALGGIDRLISITPDGEHRILAARRPDREREEPPIPDGEDAQVVEDFVAGPVAAGPDGSVYVLQGDSVARWLDGRLTTLAPRFDGARDIAVDARGGVYVADTGNGRVHRIDPDGSVRTIVGTEAERDCVGRGLDDPLALDPRRCTAVKALAVDRTGNVYMALKNAAMVAGLTPDGRMAAVAGTGPQGFGDGDGRAARARLGVVDELAVGPDGDLYVSEPERVRRIADPAGILASEPPEPEQPEGAAACAEIAALSEAAAGAGEANALERSLNALADAAPEEIRDDVDEIVAGATDQTAAQIEIRSAMGPDELGVSLGEYAEQECGLVGGFDVPVGEANAFCLAYARYLDEGDVAEAGEEPPRALDAVVEAAPPFLAESGRSALRDLERAAGRAVPDSEASTVLAGIEAINTAALSMCALG